jgi:hypothetical protein
MGVVVHIYNASTKEAKVKTLQFQDSLGPI